MTEQIQNEDPQDPQDPILKLLAESIEPVTDHIQKSEDHGLFVLGAKYIANPDGTEGVQTFLGVVGYFEIIAEGLYAELRNQLEQGETELFASIRDVIRDLEEDIGLDPEEDMGDDGNLTIH